MGRSCSRICGRLGLFFCGIRKSVPVGIWRSSNLAGRFLLGDVHNLLPETKESGTDNERGNATVVRSLTILSHYTSRFQGEHEYGDRNEEKGSQ
jgi:hypothetical protein